MVRTLMLPFRHKFNSFFIGRVDLHDSTLCMHAGQRDLFWGNTQSDPDTMLFYKTARLD